MLVSFFVNHQKLIQSPHEHTQTLANQTRSESRDCAKERPAQRQLDRGNRQRYSDQLRIASARNQSPLDRWAGGESEGNFRTVINLEIHLTQRRKNAKKNLKTLRLGVFA